MAVLYKLWQDKRKESVNKGKWYARSWMTETTDLKKISEIVQRNCSMKKSDVNAVLTELFEVIRDELQASHRVKIDGLGSFKIGLKTIPADTEAEFAPSKNVVGKRINFLPCIEVDENNRRYKPLLAGVKLTPWAPKQTEDDDEPEP